MYTKDEGTFGIMEEIMQVRNECMISGTVWGGLTHVHED